MVAAEKAFRGVVIHIIALVVGTLVYHDLMRQGYIARIPDWNSDGLSFGLESKPLLRTFFVIAILNSSVLSYYSSVKTLIRRGFMGDALSSAFSRHKKYYCLQARRALEEHGREKPF